MVTNWFRSERDTRLADAHGEARWTMRRLMMKREISVALNPEPALARVAMECRHWYLAVLEGMRERATGNVQLNQLNVGAGGTGEAMHVPTLNIIQEVIADPAPPKVIAGPGGMPIEIGDSPRTRRTHALRLKAAAAAEVSEGQEADAQSPTKRADLREYSAALSEGVAAVERAAHETGYFPATGQRRAWAEKQPAFRKASRQIADMERAAAEETQRRIESGEFGKA